MQKEIMMLSVVICFRGGDLAEEKKSRLRRGCMLHAEIVVGTGSRAVITRSTAEGSNHGALIASTCTECYSRTLIYA